MLRNAIFIRDGKHRDTIGKGFCNGAFCSVFPLKIDTVDVGRVVRIYSSTCRDLPHEPDLPSPVRALPT